MRTTYEGTTLDQVTYEGTTIIILYLPRQNQTCVLCVCTHTLRTKFNYIYTGDQVVGVWKFK
jgi:hypothetical protein